MGSPGASTYSPLAPHPYMQKTRTLDFGIVLEGEIVLVLDTQEVPLKTGDFVVLRGSESRVEQPVDASLPSWRSRRTTARTVTTTGDDYG